MGRALNNVKVVPCRGQTRFVSGDGDVPERQRKVGSRSIIVSKVSTLVRFLSEW